MRSTVEIHSSHQAFSASAIGGGGESGAAARSSFICGKGAVAQVKIGGNGDSRIIVKRPGSNDTSNPLDMYSTVGWKVDAFAAKVLNTSWVINMVHYGSGACN